LFGAFLLRQRFSPDCRLFWIGSCFSPTDALARVGAIAREMLERWSFLKSVESFVRKMEKSGIGKKEGGSYCHPRETATH
jgi:hypothetical protein